jgi:hypothetical protein
MNYFYLFIAIVLFSSCEDVVNLPLEEGPKKLVIDANINWKKGTDGKEQSIRLTETAGFYESVAPIATGASVKITGNNQETIFTEDGDTGIYKTTNFNPKINDEYTLQIVYNTETFTASEILNSVTAITGVEQSTESFFGNEALRVDFYYTDPITEGNYYLEEFSSSVSYLNSYRVSRDEFINGNENSGFEINEDLIAGETITFRLYGISRDYHNYASLLLAQIQDGGPFATPPAAVLGNCENTTNPNEKPLGYFRLSEVAEETYNIQ